MPTSYTYAAALAASEKVHWRVEDLIGGDKRLDFTRPFLPASMAKTSELDFLSPAEQLALNQIRAHEYLCMFGLVEEFILPFVLDHARPHLSNDDHRTRALLVFAAEEAKHIHLFRRFREEFRRGFRTECEVIGPAAEVGRAVLAHGPLGVALAVLHIEWITQRHWHECVRDDRGLDPQFVSLLKHHWMEEAQHTKIDTLLVEALAAGLSAAEIDRAVEEYLDIGGFLDQGLVAQVDLNLASLERATGRRLTEPQKERFRTVQLKALRWTYLGSGMTHPNFVETLSGIRPSAAERIAAVAPAFC